MQGFKLTLFGGFNLTDANGEALVLRAKKARALFIYLVVNGGRAISRDRLSYLLWSDSSEAQARHSLRQALADIRKAVGSDSRLILSEGDEVRIDPDRLESDVATFESLVRSSENAKIEQAIDLYQGELAEGFISREEAFDDWLDAERQRLQTLALESMKRYLEFLPAGKTGEYRFELARKILSIDPLDENAQCQIIEYHAGQLQPHLAIRQFERYRDLLQKELGIPPGAQIVAAIKRLRERSAQTAMVDTPETVEHADLYKNLTVLSLYICGFDEEERNNAEGFRNRLDKITDFVRSLVESHRGQVYGALANQIIAVFDTGRINYNIDLAALQAAIDCRQGLRQTFDLDLKATLTSGQLVLQSGRRKQTLTSPVVVEAVELTQRCHSGEVLLSRAVYEHCQGQAECSCIDNSERPVYRLDRVTLSGTLSNNDFVGRRMECAQFAAALDSVSQWQTGQVILVRGEAGIGKSTLCRQFQSMIAQDDAPDVAWWSLELTPARRSLSDLLSDLLKTLVSDAGYDPAKLSRAELIDFCVQRQLDESAAALLLGLLERPSESGSAVENIEDQLRIQQQSLLRLLAWGLDSRPCCLLVEDIHLAEAGLMDAIAQLANLTGSKPLLLLLTARSDGEPLDPAWRGQFFSAQLTLMELNVFNQQESRQFAAGFTSLSDDYRERCLQRSQGHPLFLEQLLSSADEALDLLPDSIHKSIQHHLDRLDLKHQHAAQSLALAGLNIETSLLGFLQIDPESLESLIREQIIVRRDERLAFRHQLMHEVIVQNTLPSRRLELHKKLADYFQLRDEHRYAEHLIHTDAENRVEVMVQSVLGQMAQGRYEEACRLIELAQSLLDEQAFRPLRSPQVKLLHRLGHNGRALQLCVAYLDSCSDPAECCQLSIEKGRIELLLDRLDEAEASLQQALELEGKAGCHTYQAEIQLLLGNAAFSANRLQQCLDYHRQALDLAREQGNDELVRQALGGLGDAYYSLGRMATAAGYYQQAVEYDSPGSTQAGNRAMLGYCQVFMLEMALAERNLAESIRQAERLYDLRGEALARNTESIRLIEVGEYQTALEQLSKALAISQNLGSTRFVLDNLALLGLVVYHLGDIERAQQLMQSAWSQCEPEFEGFIGATIAGNMARICSGAEAQQHWLDEGERLLTVDALSHNHLHFYRQAIEISLDNDNPAQARYYADKLQRYTCEEPLPWAEAVIARVPRLQDS